ncbi:MAG: potassium uptake system protein [Chloroflexi bacterium]|nr:MAG: potassium uptake system protein [Chloroflexota bacterium]
MRFLDRLNPLAARQARSAQANIPPAATVTYAHPSAGRKKEEFVVIGLGRFGTAVTRTLVAYGHNVLAIDNDIQRVQDLSTSLPHVLQLDATNVDALRQAGVEAFDTGLVCIGTDFESNVLATVLLRRLGVKRVVTKARTRTQREILLRVGADEVILPEHEAGVRLARRLAAGHFIDYLEVGADVGVVELLAPPAFWGHTLAESELRQRFGLTAMAVRRGDELLVSPSANFRIEPNDILVVLGKIEDAERLSQ